MDGAWAIGALAGTADARSAHLFLAANDWPYHGVPRLTAEDAAEVPLESDDVASFWIRDRDELVGLIRLLDLNDVDDGSPLFDLRIATRHRGAESGGLRWIG